MKQSKTEIIEQVTRNPGDHAYDGIITEVLEDYVHVRLAGSPRKIIQNVIIADHIDKTVLRRGMFCKISSRYQRDQGRHGRTILTDILPQLNYADYAGKGTGIPPAPIVSVSSSCETQEWLVSWTQVAGATYYELYWATDDQGSASTLITETIEREYSVPFDTATPPKIYFAVRAISGVNEGALSVWVTDVQYLASTPLVTFGDDENHGHVTTEHVRWRCLDGAVQKSTTDGASWETVTPPAPANTWGDTPAPAAADVSFVQVFGDDSRIFTLGKWENSSGQRRGTMWVTTTGGTSWTELVLRNNLEDELMPIWADYNDTYLLLTVWQDVGGTAELRLQEWDFAALTYTTNHNMGAATAAEVDSKNRYLFPICDPLGDDLAWYVAGNFVEVPV